MIPTEGKSLINKDDEFIIVKLDSYEFAVAIDQIEGIKEFSDELREDISSEFGLSQCSLDGKIIPILDLKKYLYHQNSPTVPSSQSRILLTRIVGEGSDIGTGNIGIVFDAIIGVHRGMISCRENNKENSLSSELNVFLIDSCIEIDSRSYPILNLEKLIDFSLLKNLLKNNL